MGMAHPLIPEPRIPNMGRDLMQCSGCGEFCITGLSGTGDRYRIGASSCLNCGGSGLRTVEDTIEGLSPV